MLKPSGREGWREAAPSEELCQARRSFSGVPSSSADSGNGEKLPKEPGLGRHPAWERALGELGGRCNGETSSISPREVMRTDGDCPVTSAGREGRRAKLSSELVRGLGEKRSVKLHGL